MPISEKQLAEVLIGVAKAQAELAHAIAMEVDRPNVQSLFSSISNRVSENIERPSRLEELPGFALRFALESREKPDPQEHARLLETLSHLLSEDY